jgi:hypothetical protein
MSKWSSAFRDSRWQKLRLEIMERDGWTCKSCGATGNGVTLNVHHAYYESGKAPWEYPTDTLVTWCEDCHGKIHEAQKRIALIIARHSVYSNEDKTIDIMEFFEGVYDSRFMVGPSWRSTKSYCRGFAVGRLSIDDTSAEAITRSWSVSPSDWRVS